VKFKHFSRLIRTRGNPAKQRQYLKPPRFDGSSISELFLAKFHNCYLQPMDWREAISFRPRFPRRKCRSSSMGLQSEQSRYCSKTFCKDSSAFRRFHAARKVQSRSKESS